MTFADLRREYETVGIGEQIYGLLDRLADRICRRYPAGAYNNNLPWSDETVADLVQEIVADQLLGEGQLDYIFDNATTLESVGKLLRRQVKRQLYRRLAKGPIDRLLTRTKRLAADGHLEEVAGAFTSYRPIGSTAVWAPLHSDQLRAAADAASEIPILFSDPNASRESQILTTPALKAALERFFSVCEPVSDKELRQIFEILLTPWVPRNLVFIDDLDVSIEAPMTDTTATTELLPAVSAWVDSLSINECWVWYDRTLGLADQVTADRIGKSRATVINLKQAVNESARTRLLADVEPDQHIDAITLARELCARRLGDAT